MEKIIETGNKVDFHIHSIASKHKESDDCVDLSTIDNIDLLIDKLNQREINMCSISDHDNFDFNIYNRLKQEENKGSIKKVFPAVEFSVTYDKKVLHVITIFDDKDSVIYAYSKVNTYDDGDLWPESSLGKYEVYGTFNVTGSGTYNVSSRLNSTED